MSDSQGFILLKNVRCNFPRLFGPEMIKGKEYKSGVTLLLDPDKDEKKIKKLEDAIESILKQNKVKKLASDKKFLRDGDESGREEQEGYMIAAASNNSAPVVVDSSGSGVISDERKNLIYGGCYVNVKIRPWFQDNDHGKRVNAELVSIQFAGEGEVLDGTHVSVDKAVEGFDEVEDDGDDFLD